MIYPNKLEYVNKVLQELQSNPDNPWRNHTDKEKLIFEWFITARQGDGLRLTDAGVNAFKLANIEHYDIEFGKKTNRMSYATLAWQKFILELNDKIRSPYYVGIKLVDNNKQPYIRLYDEKIAMMLTLYGDIHSYLESVRSTK